MLIPNINVSVEAEVKQGKSTFVYTAPPPIVGFQWDQGVEGALFGKYSLDKGLFDDYNVEVLDYDPALLDDYRSKITAITARDIFIFNLPALIQLSPTQYEGASELWRYHQELLYTAQHTKAVRSIVEDTMTAAKGTAADAHLENEQRDRNTRILRAQEHNMIRGQVPWDVPSPRLSLIQIEYGKPNSWVRDIYPSTKGAGKNLLVTHHLTDERESYVDRDGSVKERLTGKRVLDGVSRTYGLIDIALRFERTRIKNPMNEKEFINAVQAKFIWCRWNLDLEGEVLNNPTWDTLMKAVELSLNSRVSLPRRSAGAI